MHTPNQSSRFFSLLFAGIVLTASTTSDKAYADAEIYRKALKSTTWVLAKNSDGTSSGTGVLIDAERKLMVTNAHVVGDSRSTVVFFPAMKNDRPIVSRNHYLEKVKSLGIRGRVIAIDRKRDLALVQLSKIPAGAAAIELAQESASPGETVESIGNSGSTQALWVYTSGKVRTVYKKQFRTGAGEHDFMVVETTSPINAGDSGGPVVNSEGKLVAVAQAIAPKARLVSYNVDITEIKDFMQSPWKPAPLPVTEVLKNADLEFTKHSSGHYQLEVATGDDEDKDEKETVFITKDIEYYERADVRKIWALAQTVKTAPDLETSLRLLEQNARTKLGSWTVEKTSAGEYLIIFCAKIDATATHDSVKSTIEYVAKLTRSMRSALSPKIEAKNAKETLSDWLGE